MAIAKRDLRNAYATADLDAVVAHTNNVNNLTGGLKIAEEGFAKLFPAEEVVA